MSSMSTVIDFLEMMGSDARLRHASDNDVELALTQADVDGPMSEAILAKNADTVRALLGQVRMGMQQTPVPTPTPQEIPRPTEPEPGKKEDEEEGKTGKPSSHAGGAPSTTVHSSS
jgi:hypothetical protein